MGILAGDALLNYAFETAAEAFDDEEITPVYLKSYQVLAKKAGAYGMIGGQVVDIETEGMTAEQVTKERLEYIHLLKLRKELLMAAAHSRILKPKLQKSYIKLVYLHILKVINIYVMLLLWL